MPFYLLCNLFWTNVVVGQNFRQDGLLLRGTYGIDMASLKESTNRNFLHGLHLSYKRDIKGIEKEWIRILQAKNLSFEFLWHDMTNMVETVNNADYSRGHALGALAGIDFQLFQIGSARWMFSPSLGLSYISQNINTQPQTKTIGGYINMSLHASLDVEIPVVDRWRLLAGVNVVHYSNGGLKIPNGGINAVTGSLGIKTLLRNQNGRSLSPCRSTFHHIEGSSFELAFGMGKRGKYRSKEGFTRAGIYAGYNYYLHQAFGLKAGVDMVYYHTVFDSKRHTNTFQYYGSSYDRLRVGAGIGADVAMDRFVVSSMVGKYLHYNSLYDWINWYWTTGLRYFFTSNIGIHGTLYMHRLQADFVNWGVIVKL